MIKTLGATVVIDAADPVSEHLNHRIALVGVIAVLCVYNFIFAFSFFPVTEGWFTAYAHLILDGKIPYRDFYLYLTPFYSVLLSGFIYLFGESYFGLRLFGMIIMLMIGILLYQNLSRFFSPASSMFATIVACVYYQSGVAHIPYDFTQVLTLFTLASTLMLILASEIVEGASPWKWKSTALGYLFFAGLFASLAFFTKQSNGAFVVLGASVSFFYVCIDLKKKDWSGLAAFAAGGLTPAIILLAWLAHADALHAFWQQIFVGAMAAKGSGNQILFSWMKGLMTPVFVVQMISIVKWMLAIIIISLILQLARYVIAVGKTKSLLVSIKIVVGILLSFAALWSAYTGFPASSANWISFGTQVNNYIIPVAVSVAIFLLVGGIVSCVIPRLNHLVNASLVVSGVMAVGMICGNGTSAGLSEIGVFTMFALVLAALMDLRLFRYVGFFVALGLGFSLIVTFANKKFEHPYAWWGVKEPSVHLATHRAQAPIFMWLRMSKETAENLDAISASLAKAPFDGEIFAFPNIPFIYLLTNRWPDSKVIVPWFDFLPDEPARKEAERLLNKPPSVIVNVRLPEEAWTAHERLFRDGAPMGQRDIQRTIKVLTEEQSLYDKDYTSLVSDGSIIDIWHKKK